MIEKYILSGLKLMFSEFKINPEDLEFRADEKKAFKNMTITEVFPGPISKDFMTVLEIIDREDIPATGKLQIPPQKKLAEINQRLTNPNTPALKRPVFKSFPYIQGLILLLKATGTITLVGKGSKQYLRIDPVKKEFWQKLNPTELYFNLLEFWIKGAPAEIINERSFFGFGDIISLVLEENLDKYGFIQFEYDRLTYTPGLFMIALADLFGLITIKHGFPVEGQAWVIDAMQLTPDGRLIMNMINKVSLQFAYESYQNPDTKHHFSLQQALLPYFPEWQTVMSTPTESEFQDGVYIFKVKLGGGVWWRISLPAQLTFEEFSNAILNAAGFDHDHLYCFTLRDAFFQKIEISHPEADGDYDTDEVRIGEIGLKVGQQLSYVFDFGDWWEFDIILEKIDPPNPEQGKWEILEEHGEPPEQYPDYDDEW